MEPRTSEMSITIPYANLYNEYTEARTVISQAIERCIANSSFIGGEEVQNFENTWKRYTRAEDCAGVSSGTSALMLALWAVGVRPGHEVLVPSMSFIASAECASQINARPRFVDIDQHYLMDLDHLESQITEKTKAIIVVDLYGQTVDMEKLRRIADGIPIIQDAAQSAGCLYRGTPICSHADLTCFSFYPGKNLSAMGDAGAVTGSRELIAIVKMLRDHGRKEKYVHETIGWNERLDAMQAAIITAKFNHLDDWNNRRRKNASVYYDILSSCDKIGLPKINSDVSTHVYNQFVITTDRRDELKQFLLTRGIETGVQFPLALHQQPVYSRISGQTSFPNSEKLAATCLSLPVHAHIIPDQVRTVANSIMEFFN